MNDIQTPLFKVHMPDSIKDPILETMFSGYVTEGDKAKEFENSIASFIGNKNTMVVSSCTMALTIAYRLAGVGFGDEVITTPLTSIASNVPILSLGAKPVWVDVEKDTGMVDPNKLEGLITEKTKAILILHKEGDLAKLDEIISIAKKHNIKVIEDAAHAFGAKYRGTKIGNHADFTCYSFQAIKQITSADGGALVCKNNSDYERGRKLKWFGVDKANKGPGNPWYRDITEIGYKADLNDVLATIGLEQMKYVDQLIEAHNKNGILFEKLLQDVDGLSHITRSDLDYSSYWAFTLIVENRDRLQKKLATHGIASMQIHPRNDVWSIFKESRRDLPGVDYFAYRELSIPCGWWVTEDEVYRIVDIIKRGW